MRLINAKSRGLEEFTQDEAPPYAILSHRWGDAEVTFDDVRSPNSLYQSKDGYFKLDKCCAQALKDGLEFVWIDTCCIDKSSSAELSESINSMFSRYKNARFCYAFLNDVLPGDINDKASPCEESFRNSKWFTRGWTLQELLAPSNLRFYSHDWTHIGDKASSISLINNITGIYDAFLMNADLSRACIAERMSWASLRKVTRKEDIAYSLLGIFGINMPLLYGEGGENAFIRLQEELIKSSNDESIFAWHVGLRTCPVERPSAQYCMGLLARSPSFFEKCTDITQASFGQLPSFIMANGMIRMALLVEKSANPSNGAIFFAHLRCRRRYDFENVLAIPLVSWNGVYYRVYDEPNPMEMNFWRMGFMREMTAMLSPRKADLGIDNTKSPFIIRTLPGGYKATAVDPPDAARGDVRSHIILTDLTWENLWEREYKGQDIIRGVLLEATESFNTPPLALLLTVSSHSLPGEKSWLRYAANLHVLKSRESFASFMASRRYNRVSPSTTSRRHHWVHIPRLTTIAHTEGTSQMEEEKLIEYYYVTAEVAELSCGPALVVDVLGDNTIKAMAKKPLFNNQVIVGACLCVLVTLTWYLDSRHPLTYNLPWFETEAPRRRLSMTGLTITCYTVLQALWIFYGSLTTGFSLQKVKEHFGPFFHEESIKFLILASFMCWLSFEVSFRTDTGLVIFFVQILIVIIIVRLKVPASLMSRRGRPWNR